MINYLERVTALLNEFSQEGSQACRAESSLKLRPHIDRSEFILYGAGQTGNLVVEKLRAIEVKPLSFADNTAGKNGTLQLGVPVVTLDKIKETYGIDACIIVTIFNPSIDYKAIKGRLEAEGFRNVYSFLDLFYLLPDLFLPYYQYDNPWNIARHKEDLLAAFELFKEERSQQVFFSNLIFRLKLAYEELLPGDHGQYFPEDLFPQKENSRPIYIDCGAFDGDTIKTFIRKHRSYSKVYAYEPDDNNFTRLTSYVTGLDQEASRNIILFKMGVSDQHGFERFSSNNSMGSSLSEHGDTIIQTISLDEILCTPLAESGQDVFIKFDIEGEEEPAIMGCRNIIARNVPNLAVSIYHRPGDLWKITRLIHGINKNYNFYLRQHGPDGMDLVLYAAIN
jgi:FkbM family methyltransferase